MPCSRPRFDLERKLANIAERLGVDIEHVRVGIDLINIWAIRSFIPELATADRVSLSISGLPFSAPPEVGYDASYSHRWNR